MPVVRVERCCNGCGQRLRPATNEECEAAIDGPLPDVRSDCPYCAAATDDLVWLIGYLADNSHVGLRVPLRLLPLIAHCRRIYDRGRFTVAAELGETNQLLADATERDR